MNKIFENGFRWVLNRHLGSEVESFVFDGDWRGLHFLPELGSCPVSWDEWVLTHERQSVAAA